MPGSVIGNTAAFGAAFPGSSPGRAVYIARLKIRGGMRKSFTLIELIVVIAIIAILAAIIAPNAFKAIEKAKVARAISDFKTIKTGVMSLYADTGRWVGPDPCDFAVVSSALFQENWPTAAGSPLPGWDGPYLESFTGMHPWGGTYYFEGEDDLPKSPTEPADGNRELSIDFDNGCYGVGPGASSGCPVPDNAAVKIDETIDDSNNSWGNFRHWPSGDTQWVLLWGPR